MLSFGGISLKKPTQKEQVLRHLQECGSITTLQAFKRYHITRLSEYIRELRADGYLIKTTYRMHGKKPDVYATYVLEEK